jgi:hypothetical protein
MFVNIAHAGEGPCSARLNAYVARIHARPSFRAVIEEETPVIQRFRAA